MGLVFFFCHYPPPLWGFSEIMKGKIQMEHNKESHLVGDKPVGYFTSVAKDLNSGLPRTNPTSGQGGT